MECSNDAHMTRQLPGWMSSLVVGRIGLSNGSLNIPSVPSEPSAVTLRRRAKYSASQKKSVGSGHARHSQTCVLEKPI